MRTRTKRTETEVALRTFKDDTEGTLSDLLPHTVMYTDYVAGSCRGVGVRHVVGRAALKGKERRKKRKKERGPLARIDKKPSPRALEHRALVLDHGNCR